MKIVTDNTTTIERIGVGTDQSFKINFDAKMARILADGLYSDKIQSVIRELSCNAYDSHVMAGCADRAIEVHFPNRFDPFFYVEDFGIGLSHEDVLNIYTTYGASTKTTSNEVMGQLGLGSKSPFSLTDAFTVTARKDGVENHYSMYRNEQGMPSVAHLHNKFTDLGNGVRVTVPVRFDQRQEFIDKAKAVYKWFPVKPRVLGDDVEFPEIQYEYKGTDWGIRKPSASSRSYYSRPSSERPVAVMGMVAYPLEVDMIKNLSQGAQYLMRTPLVLNFAIGDLEVAANREALGYDDRTCANILEKMETMTRELGELFEKQICSAKSLWYARQQFGEIFGNNHYSTEFSGAYKHLGLKWQNEVIKSNTVTIDLKDLYPTITVGTEQHVDAAVYESNCRFKRPRRIPQLTSYSLYEVSCASKTVIVFNDLKLGALGRVQEYNRGKDHKLNIVVFNPSPKASWDKISKALGNPDVVYASTLPRKAKAPTKRTGALRFLNTSRSGVKAWEQVEIDLDQGGYYVNMEGWETVTQEGTHRDLYYVYTQAREAGLLPTQDLKIHAMRGKLKREVKNHPKWKEFFSTIHDKLKLKMADINFKQVVADLDSLENVENNIYWTFWNTDWPVRDQTGNFAKFCEAANSIGTNYTKNNIRNSVRSMTNLATRYGITIDKASARYDFVSMYEKLCEHYPMLSFVMTKYRYGNPTSDEKSKLLQYINFVDTCYTFYSLQDHDTVELT